MTTVTQPKLWLPYLGPLSNNSGNKFKNTTISLLQVGTELGQTQYSSYMAYTAIIVFIILL